MKYSDLDIEHIAQELYDQASSFKDAFLANIKEITQANNCIWDENQKQYAVKEKSSIIEKIKRKQNLEISDLLRSTIIIKKPSDVIQILEFLKKFGYQIIEIDDLYKYESNEIKFYKHIAIKLKHKHSQNLIMELLLMQQAMYEAKMGKGHLLYDYLKEFEILKQKQQGKLSETQIKQQNLIISLSNEIYKKAYEIDNPT